MNFIVFIGTRPYSTVGNLFLLLINIMLYIIDVEISKNSFVIETSVAPLLFNSIKFSSINFYMTEEPVRTTSAF